MLTNMIISGIVLFLSGSTVSAAPEPALVPGPQDWTLDINYRAPAQIVIPGEGSLSSRRYWYIILTVTNRTGRDVGFFPKCELMTDTFQIMPAGAGVSPAVFSHIRVRHQNDYPFLQQFSRTDSRMLQGEDNTRDVAIIWPDFDPEARSVKFFISGLSNETAVVDHPVAADSEGRPVKVYLRKTLQLEYLIGGDARFRSDARAVLKDRAWVMR